MYKSLYEKISDLNYDKETLSFNTDKIILLFKRYNFAYYKDNNFDVDRNLVDVIFPDAVNLKLRFGHAAGVKSFYIYYELNEPINISINVKEISSQPIQNIKPLIDFETNPLDKNNIKSLLDFIFNNSRGEYSQYVNSSIDLFNSNLIFELDKIAKEKRIIDPRSKNISQESTPDFVLNFVKKYINTMSYIKNLASQKKSDVEQAKADILSYVPKVYDWYQNKENKIDSNIIVFRGLDFIGLDKNNSNYNSNKLKAVKSLFKIKKLEDLLRLNVGEEIRYSHKDYSMPISCSRSRKVSTDYALRIKKQLRNLYPFDPNKSINGISLLIKSIIKPEEILLDTNIVETTHPFQNEIILSPTNDYLFKIVDFKIYN